MAKKYSRLLENMVTSIEKIEQLIDTGFKKGFNYILKFKSQVLKNLESLGGSIKEISSKIKRKHRGISKIILSKIGNIRLFFENFIDLSQEDRRF